jgi:hypothetical protein
VVFLVGTGLAIPPLRAAERAALPAAPAERPAHAPPVTPSLPAPASSLTQSQIDAFAGLVNEDTEIVSQRLLWDPSLAPLVAAAADARTDRRRTGMGLTIAGFGILGVGLITGVVMYFDGALAGWGDCPFEGGSGCESGPDHGEMKEAGIIILVAHAVGLSMGFWGVSKLAGTSEAETRALERYQSPGPGFGPYHPPSALRGPASVPPKSLNIRLLSFTF